MDMIGFVRFATSDPAVSEFLKKISKNLEKKQRPPKLPQSINVPPGWLSVLSLLLWLSMPWVRRGWRWMTVKQLELDDLLAERVQEIGLKPESVAKASNLFLDELITSSGNDELKDSLMSVMDQIES